MAIKFADFVPRQVKAPGFLTSGEYLQGDVSIGTQPRRP